MRRAHVSGTLFFSSPIGLGHAARDAAIAEYLDGVRFVSGGPAARLLRESGYEARDEYDPPRFDVRGGRLRGKTRWLLRYLAYYRACKKKAREIIADESPETVASDEDFAAVAAAREAGVRCVLVTDVLETRFTGSPLEKAANRAMARMARGCEAVVMPEHGADSGNIRRVGPIVRRPSAPREQLREELGFAGKTALVTAGGTDAGAFLLDRAAGAAEKAGARAVVVSGPALPVRDAGFVPNLHDAVCAADVVISLAGRSTMDEARAYGTPGVFIPIGDHFEQQDNAAREGYSHADLAKLDELVARALEKPRGEPLPSGAPAAARVLANG